MFFFNLNNEMLKFSIDHYFYYFIFIFVFTFRKMSQNIMIEYDKTNISNSIIGWNINKNSSYIIFKK